MSGGPICFPGIMYRCGCGKRNWRDSRGAHLELHMAVHTPTDPACPILSVEIPSRSDELNGAAWKQIQLQIEDAVRLMRQEYERKIEEERKRHQRARPRPVS